MSRLSDHLMMAPVVLPLLAGAIMLALGGERRRTVNAAINVVSTAGLVVIAIALLQAADSVPTGIMGVYRLGDCRRRSRSCSSWTGYPLSCCC